MIILLIAYFLLLLVVSHFVSRRTTDTSFYQADRRSRWYMVAFGMVGASISGVSFVSVPGMVLHSGLTYLETCAGFIVGYFVVAYVLLPIYYKSNFTSIYAYLQNINHEAYRTGSLFFIVSKLFGAAAKFYVPCFIISRVFSLNFALVVLVLLFVVWLYTRRGGIKTLVWTDTLQTLCMLVCLGALIWSVSGEVSFRETAGSIGESYDFHLPAGLLRFVSGIFIVIVMTGLDQDMMQKNLTCRSLCDAQKDMCSYGFAFLPINALFLLLGIMLVGVYQSHGMLLPTRPDDLLTLHCLRAGGAVLALFVLGIASTSLSTVDSALTALTTTVCTDVAGHSRRPLVHVIMTLLMAVCCILFERYNTTSLIDAIYKLVSYTYGPLLGLFSFALIFKERSHVAVRGVSCACAVSLVVTLALDVFVPRYTSYTFGYELLMINGIITFALCLLLKKLQYTCKCGKK